jgi:hypothetical protein
LYRWSVKLYRWSVRLSRWSVRLYRWSVQLYRWSVQLYRWSVQLYRWSVKLYRWSVQLYNFSLYSTQRRCLIPKLSMFVHYLVRHYLSVYRVSEKYCEEILVERVKRGSQKKEINLQNWAALFTVDRPISRTDLL